MRTAPITRIVAVAAAATALAGCPKDRATEPAPRDVRDVEADPSGTSGTTTKDDRSGEEGRADPSGEGAGRIDVPVMKETTELTYDTATLARLRRLMAKPPARPVKSWTRRVERMTPFAHGRKGKPIQLTFDLSTQVLKLDVPEDRGYWPGAREGQPRESAPRSSFAALGARPALLSAAELAYKAKQFDDGLYAAVELAAERGAGDFPGKRGLLQRLAASVGGIEPRRGPAVVVAAAQLGGHEVKAPRGLADAVERERSEFLGDARRSKPIGFYTWSEQLMRIFRQDRMLQTPLKPAEATALAGALRKDTALLAAYDRWLALPRRLTNPYVIPGLGQLARGAEPKKKKYALLPPSRSHETELAKKLYGNRPIPPGFNLADEMIKRIRAGKLSLAPTAGSGWYDHQVHALEPLVVPDRMPEGKRLQLTDAYRKELLGLFKALLALTRETHIKQLETPRIGAGMPVMQIEPEVSVEPLPSYYLRRARSYVFVRKVLRDAFGAAALGKLRRITAAGAVNMPLAEELRLMQGLFHGAYLTACRELGLEPADTRDLGDPRDMLLLEAWAKTRAKDPEMYGDVRVMVPVFYDIKRRKTKVWVVLGVDSKPLNIAFARRPRLVRARGADGKPARPGVSYDDTTRSLRYFVTAEVYVNNILDRNELRTLCDKHKLPSKILAALGR